MNRKINSILYKNRGITLVELIVAMALTVIILAASAAFVTPLYGYYGQKVNEAKAIKVSGLIEDRLKQIIPSAVEMHVDTSTYLSPVGADYYYIYVSNNKIVYRLHGTTQTFIADADYQGFTVALDIKTKCKLDDVSANRNTVLVFVVKIYRNSTLLITRSVVINLFNMDNDTSRKIYRLTSPMYTTNPSESVIYKSIKFKTF